ncbi:hypothetical protein RchiOBHm_Chr1g0318381 [Rosa chinensis]|uniref:Uncharacterized protein n=1 Tax=Rosa chinensis TaxID=74649 RepID=A0A2P6QW40_ROSCH|nr:hypothetical protein RchiOBHm_Chr4g0413161 [Rosa chinensis]PRQ54867.1 hypothetical protein RchiOBHm_Chr1g0318381 [Rosa chinensis]
MVLCVAFGSPAEKTQRGSTLKDFTKRGCRCNWKMPKKVCETCRYKSKIF